MNAPWPTENPHWWRADKAGRLKATESRLRALGVKLNPRTWPSLRSDRSKRGPNTTTRYDNYEVPG